MSSTSEDTDRAAARRALRRMKIDAIATLVFGYAMILLVWVAIAIWNGRIVQGSIFAIFLFALATFFGYRKLGVFLK